MIVKHRKKNKREGARCGEKEKRKRERERKVELENSKEFSGHIVLS